MEYVIAILAVCLLPQSFGDYQYHHDGRPIWGYHNNNNNNIQHHHHHENNNKQQYVRYTGLRVKYGPSAEQADKDYFYSIPRTVSTARADGWVETQRPPGALPQLTMYCPPGRGVCPLYDPHTGFVAGLQVAIPVNDYQFFNPESKFIKWHAPATPTEPARDYWTTTQYYVSENSLRKGEGPFPEDGNTLQDGGVWVTAPGGSLIELPLTEAAINASEFTRQHCIPSMGRHYYLRMTPNLKCEDLLPWFALTTNKELVGVGFIMFGRLAQQQPRHYFEVPPSRDQVSVPIIPTAPQCLWDWQANYGMMTMHIYYVDDPWNIRCN